MEKKYNAIMLVAEGDYAVVKMEVNGKWIELIRERLDSTFSHIIEPAGIEIEVNKITPIK